MFEEFLLGILPKEMIPYTQRAFGYCLTGLVGEEVLFLWWGNGANGKSTLRETIFELMGDYVIAADATLLIERKNSGGGATPEVARLHGKRLVTINETSKGDVLNEARVKFITGQDTITARNLYEDFFDFKPTHKTIPATNHKPIVKGLDEGIWRRIHLWPFLITIPKEERDKFFRQKLLVPELSGILNWMLRGLKDYQVQGLKPSKTVEDATKEYRKDMDLITLWIEERCIRADGVRSHNLYQDYKEWSLREINGAISSKKFTIDLKTLGFEQDNKKRGRPIIGLRLVTWKEKKAEETDDIPF